MVVWAVARWIPIVLVFPILMDDSLLLGSSGLKDQLLNNLKRRTRPAWAYSPAYVYLNLT